MKLLSRSIIISILCISFAHAATTELSPLDDLKQRLTAIKTIQADFSQTISRSYQDRTNIEAQQKGKFWLAKPNRFRWHTAAPDNQLIVADGSSLWVYDEELEQVTVQTLHQQLPQVPLLLLSGDNNIIKETYTVTKTNASNYYLIARDPSSLIRKLNINFNGEQLAGLKIIDSTGATTNITLSNSQQNLALPPSLFAFKVPPGVDVIGSAE